MNSKYLLAIGGLAAGIATGMSATPAGAVIIAPGSVLSFSDGAENKGGTINVLAPDNSFTATFNGGIGATANVVPTGTFSNAAVFGVGGSRPVSLTSSLFTRVGPSTTVDNTSTGVLPNNIDYSNNSPLVFNFGSAGTLTLGAGSFFIANAPGNASFNIYNNSLAPDAPNFFGTFTNNGDSTTVQFEKFEFTVDPTTSAFGNYAIQVKATAVPEPFTIIGTLVGGTAALRLRKKLSSSAKN